MNDANMDYARGKRIAALREKHGFSQDALADEAKISRPSMSKIENGHDFKVSNLMNLVSALDVSPMQILYDEAWDRASLVDDIRAELNDMDENELRVLLGAIRGAKGMKQKVV